jgi:hypothetical protein
LETEYNYAEQKSNKTRVGRVDDQFKLFYMLLFGTANPFSEELLQRRDVVSLSFSKLYIIFRIG